ncbi:MAG TPA: PEP-CTERM sorting domain-containing protein [Micropepsaceae bacterium]|nr:PEP-CTERM sorting domain-containing protein [Micropepsaceae bacterium]
MAVLATGAAQADIITFDQATDPVPGSYTSFTTNSGLFTFTLQSGGPADVDLGSGTFATANCNGGTCSDNGTQALYMFGSGAIRLTSVGNTISVLNFDAAAATFAADLFSGENQFDTEITVTGEIHGGGTVSQVFQLLAGDPNSQFLNKDLTGLGFTDLDSLDFAYVSGDFAGNNAPSGDFAIDNISLTTRALGTTLPPPPPPPTGVPEPGTLGLLGAGLAGFGWLRRKMKRSAP